MITIDRKSKILLSVFLLCAIVSASVTFYRTFGAQNYNLYYDADCDPSIESCFVYHCDPQWEECTGDPEEDTWYYKTYKKSARNVRACGPFEDAGCPEFLCEQGDSNCETIYCNPVSDEECFQENK